MANKNFTQENSIKYKNLQAKFADSLKHNESCEVPNGVGGIIIVKEIGWYNTPIGKVYFLIEKGTNQKYELNTLTILADAKRE